MFARTECAQKMGHCEYCMSHPRCFCVVLGAYEVLHARNFPQQGQHLRMLLACTAAALFVGFAFQQSSLNAMQDYAARRAQVIQPRLASKITAGQPTASEGGNETVYFCCVDGDGNGCSMINRCVQVCAYQPPADCVGRMSSLLFTLH